MSWHLLAEQGCKQLDVTFEKFVNRDTIAYATSNGRYGSMDRRQDEFSEFFQIIFGFGCESGEGETTVKVKRFSFRV